jgi:hypothetical protein
MFESILGQSVVDRRRHGLPLVFFVKQKRKRILVFSNVLFAF